MADTPRGFAAFNRSLSAANSDSNAQPPGAQGVALRQLVPADGDGHSASASASVRVPLANVEGRVFERLAHFRLLPPPLRLQSDAAVAYLLAPVVFPAVFDAPSRLHRALCWARNELGGGKKDVRYSTSGNPRVSGARLLRALRRYLQVAHGMGTQDADAALQLAQTLVLGGLLSPERERKSMSAATDLLGVLDDHKQLYELVAPGARSIEGSSRSKRSDDRVVSVWDVTDGAVRAGFVFRKPPRKPLVRSSCCCDDSSVDGGDERLEPRSGHLGGARERRVYAVVNGPRHHALVLFRDDVARSQLAFVPLQDATAQYVAPPPSPRRHHPLLCHGLQVWYRHASTDTSDAMHCETLDFLDKRAQERWLRSLLDAGAVYREVHADRAAWSAPTASFYALRADRQREDQRASTDSDDGALELSTLRGRVVLVVNVPTKETPVKADDKAANLTAQLRELAALADRFGPDGLTVLVFPCAQFGDCDDDVEMANGPVDTATDTADNGWPPFVEVLAPCDVNGPDAQEVFLFLNARLPGRFGPCVDGDYCKFLVDRAGLPVKRLASETLDESELTCAVRELLDAPGDGQ